jgi:hypothetical protein
VFVRSVLTCRNMVTCNFENAQGCAYDFFVSSKRPLAKSDARRLETGLSRQMMIKAESVLHHFAHQSTPVKEV